MFPREFEALLIFSTTFVLVLVLVFEPNRGGEENDSPRSISRDIEKYSICQIINAFWYWLMSEAIDFFSFSFLFFCSFAWGIFHSIGSKLFYRNSIEEKKSFWGRRLRTEKSIVFPMKRIECSSLTMSLLSSSNSINLLTSNPFNQQKSLPCLIGTLSCFTRGEETKTTTTTTKIGRYWWEVFELINELFKMEKKIFIASKGKCSEGLEMKCNTFDSSLEKWADDKFSSLYHRFVSNWERNEGQRHRSRRFICRSLLCQYPRE